MCLKYILVIGSFSVNKGDNCASYWSSLEPSGSYPGSWVQTANTKLELGRFRRRNSRSRRQCPTQRVSYNLCCRAECQMHIILSGTFTFCLPRCSLPLISRARPVTFYKWWRNQWFFSKNNFWLFDSPVLCKFIFGKVNLLGRSSLACFFLGFEEV